MRLGVLLLSLLGVAGIARADSSCRSVEITFNPTPNLQAVVWVEDSNGNYIDTVYITRLTGSLGLANRPGNHFFKSDFRFPYGRRDMVLPIWAHKRNKQYGYVVMGGHYGNSIASCAAAGITGSDCDDETIGYHYNVSSPEPFYCSPRGGVNIMDVMSCASTFYGSKGAYAVSPGYSLYPPRADLTSFVDMHDGAEAMAFSMVNDLTAVSGATPPGNAVLNPAIVWVPPADGSYVMRVEMSLEGDFNADNTHASVNDEHSELNGYGKQFLGQGSIVYSVPFTVSEAPDTETSASYEGYGDWDGATGTLHLPDPTITDSPGSGAGRLLDIVDGGQTYRLKVSTNDNCVASPTDGGTTSNSDGGTGIGMGCEPPGMPASFTVTPHATSIDLSFASASSGPPTQSFDVRYLEATAITDANFSSATPSSNTAPPPGTPGSTVKSQILGLRPQVTYYVGVRAFSSCNAGSTVAVLKVVTPTAQFVTLHGCFIATAAFGSSMMAELDALRRLRDQRLLNNPLGKLAVAVYYDVSPPLAAALSTSDRGRAVARELLAPLVELGRRLAPLPAARSVSAVHCVVH